MRGNLVKGHILAAHRYNRGRNSGSRECPVPTDPLRPATKANSTNGRDWRYYGPALAVLCMLAVPARAQCTPKFNLSL